MLELFKAGGWVMWPIAAISVLALGIVLERFWSLRRSIVLPKGLGEEVREWARHAHLDPKHIDALRNTSPLGQVLAAGLDVRHRPREVIRERIEDVGRHVMHQMEHLPPQYRTEEARAQFAATFDDCGIPLLFPWLFALPEAGTAVAAN